jgi:hypothetical protein
MKPKPPAHRARQGTSEASPQTAENPRDPVS